MNKQGINRSSISQSGVQYVFSPLIFSFNLSSIATTQVMGGLHGSSRASKLTFLVVEAIPGFCTVHLFILWVTTTALKAHFWR